MRINHVLPCRPSSAQCEARDARDRFAHASLGEHGGVSGLMADEHGQTGGGRGGDAAGGRRTPAAAAPAKGTSPAGAGLWREC